ncbi:hypothetical protein [Frankia sp. Cj5]|uniref:hypothetical protein n=1 Tax=Frankia sp. Cj5 TaxID=2880978 RepID=UPI001EF50932|nr:hypothetical protein [Frankia sp. Cj5]
MTAGWHRRRPGRTRLTASGRVCGGRRVTGERGRAVPVVGAVIPVVALAVALAAIPATAVASVHRHAGAGGRS